MKKVLAIVLAGLMTFSLAACGEGSKPAETTAAAAETTAAPSGDTLRLAVVGPLTGNNGFAGEAMMNGIEMALNQVNAAGGVGGLTVAWDKYDTKADGNEGTLIAQKIVADGGYTAILGPWSSTVGLAMSPVIDKAGILMYAISPSHADLTKSSEWIIRQAPVAECLAKGLAETLLANNYKFGVYMYDNTNEGATNGAKMFENHFTAGGGECLIEGYAAGSKDFTPMLTKYKQQGVEFINMYGATADSALICQQARDLDMDCLIQVNDMALNAEFNTLVDGLEEIYGCGTFAIDYPNDTFQQFVSDYKAAYNEDPILHSYLGWCAATRLCKTLNELGTDDMTKVRDALRNGVQETPLGDLNFVNGDADRPTVWVKFNVEKKAFEAVTEIPSK